MITCPEDLFDLMNWEIKTEERNFSEETILSQEEKGIIKTIKKYNEIHIDQIFELSNLEPSVIQSLLMQLELKNYIFNSSGLFYSSRL